MALRRGVALVLALIGLAVMISFVALAGLWVLVGREPAVREGSTLVVRLSGELLERPPEDVVGQFLRGARARTLRGVVDNIRKAKVDARVTSLLVAPSGMSLPFWAKIQELRDAILDFRRSGKPAVAFLEYGGGREYYLATACDKIFLMPTSPLELTGLANYELFLRGTLDKIGVSADMHYVGEYKTAVNQLTERTFTPSHREMIDSLNADAFDQLVRAIADGRKKSESEVRTLIDEGPFLAEDALRTGLVDDLAYEDQIDDKIQVGKGRIRRLDADDYSGVGLRSVGLNRGPKIAVIYAVGAIASGRSQYDPLDGVIVGSDTLGEYIREVRDNSAFRAIVVRVDSPGGSSVAADVIWRELLITRTQKPDRPIVVSMADLAASGGYYIAMPAHAIVAQPGTLTGSIGIYGGKYVTTGTFDKLGMNLEAISRGRHAEMNSPDRPFNETERKKYEDQLQAFYDQFVEKAAEARHTTPEKIDAVAQGRVWTGRQARQLGLVDALGGLDRAVALAKQRAKIPQEQEVELVSYPPRRSVYELLTETFSMGSRVSPLTLVLDEAERQAAARLSMSLRVFRRGEPLALMPFVAAF